MQSRTKRVITSLAVTGLAATSIVALAQPADATIAGCPNNYVCIWAGTNKSGQMIFEENGTTMHNSPTTYFFDPNWIGVPGYSSVNNTLGRFCTYASAPGSATNILAAQTGGNLANHATNYVKAC